MAQGKNFKMFFWPQNFNVGSKSIWNCICINFPGFLCILLHQSIHLTYLRMIKLKKTEKKLTIDNKKGNHIEGFCSNCLYNSIIAHIWCTKGIQRFGNTAQRPYLIIWAADERSSLEKVANVVVPLGDQLERLLDNLLLLALILKEDITYSCTEKF